MSEEKEHMTKANVSEDNKEHMTKETNSTWQRESVGTLPAGCTSAV